MEQIVAHPLQRAHPLIGTGKAALGHNLTGRLVQIACTGIVSQPLPILEHLILIGRSQSIHIGKTADETEKIVISLSHARLL